MARLFKPDRSNREQSVQELWRKLHLASVAPPTLDLLDHYIQASRPAQASTAALQVASGMTTLAIAARWNSAFDADSLLRSAFAVMYWRTELEMLNRRIGGVSDLVRDDALHDLLQWQGLAAACGEGWFTDWVAPHMHNLFCSGCVVENSLEFSVDAPARRFFETLQWVLLIGKWPDNVQLDSLGLYGALMSKTDAPSEFQAALVDYCDYRTAQCFGYDGIDAEKKRRSSQTASLMDRGNWDQVFPFELFLLQHAHYRATGNRLSLKANHPLLRTRMMSDTFPALVPLQESEPSGRIQAFISSLGSPWHQRTPMTANYL